MVHWHINHMLITGDIFHKLMDNVLRIKMAL